MRVIGDVMPGGMVRLFDPDIKFREDMAQSSQRRIRQSARQKLYLAKQGLTAVNSSNVSALGIFGEDLYIRFLNGAVYRYPKNAEIFDKIMRSQSKGRAVWRYLRRAGVPYERVGDLPLPDKIEDEDLFKTVGRPQEVKYEDLAKFNKLTKGEFDVLALLNISPFKTFKN